MEKAVRMLCGNFHAYPMKSAGPDYEIEVPPTRLHHTKWPSSEGSEAESGKR